MRILLVEDDPLIGSAVRDHIVAAGHSVDWAATLDEAAAHARVAEFGLIILDLAMPDGNGLAFLRALRAGGAATPVIIVTARDQISDRIEGLNNGADDYLVKPFDLGELSARIHAVARRYGQRPSPEIRCGGLAIEPAERRVTGPAGDIVLTAREWAVLDRLTLRPGAVVSKAQIEDALYAFGLEVLSNTVEVYVSRLRKKVGKAAISTVRGVGYRFHAQ